MSAPVALGHFQWILPNLANRRSTAAVNIIIRNVRNKMVLIGLIAFNDGGSGKGDSARNLEPGNILADANENGCLTHFRITFVSVCLENLIVRVSVLGVSRKVISLATSEPG